MMDFANGIASRPCELNFITVKSRVGALLWDGVVRLQQAEARKRSRRTEGRMAAVREAFSQDASSAKCAPRFGP